MWRIFQLNKHLTKPGHVWSKFGSGNKMSLTSAARTIVKDGANKKDTNGSASLQDSGKQSSSFLQPSPSPTPSSESSDDGGPIGRETRRRLVEWWSREYCAGRMRLCVIGNGAILCPAVITASLMRTWKIRWTIWPIWLPICSRPYEILVRILCPRFRIIRLARMRKVYVLPSPRISMTGCSFLDDRPWYPFRP